MAQGDRGVTEIFGLMKKEGVSTMPLWMGYYDAEGSYEQITNLNKC